MTAKFLYAGEAIGFVIAIEGGPVIYHAGDTSVFSDMQIIRELYAPEIGLLPIGDHYTMGPKAAALAAKYLGVKTVVPIHYGTFPQLTGTPEELEGYLQWIRHQVLKPKPGEDFALVRLQNCTAGHVFRKPPALANSWQIN